MKMKREKLFIILSLILIPGIAFGAVIDCPYFGGGKNLLNYPKQVNTTGELKEQILILIENIIYFLRECLVKPVLIGVIILGGVYIMISAGDPGKLEKGKKIILAGIIGLIIIFGAEAIADLFKLGAPSPPAGPPAPPPATCSSYTTEGDCTAAGCKWCSGCNGDLALIQECKNPSEVCRDDWCSKACGAECEVDQDCIGYPIRTCQKAGNRCFCMGVCIKGGALILTPNGFKKIEDLKEGDYVIGYKEGKKVKSKILEKSVHEGEFELYFYKGYWFTGNHLVYLDDYKEFKPVAELSNIKIKYVGKVYNIQTETQNYFGENGLLIHNK
jgi:hypothetical protein